MSAKLFFLPYQVATVAGIAQPGAKLYFYTTGTTTPLTPYTTSALTTHTSNPVIANGAGRFIDIYLDSTKTYRVIVKDRGGNTLDDIDPFIPGTAPDASALSPYSDAAAASALAASSSATSASGSASSALSYLESLTALPTSGLSVVAASRAALAMLATTAPAILTETGRAGIFKWSSSNNSANVTADAQQGIYVPPSSDTTGASGAWVRQYSGPVDVRWFGAVADCTAYGVGTDNSTAIQAAINYQSGKGGAVLIPDGKFRCSTRLDIKSAVRLIGTTTLQDSTSVSHPDAERGSTLVFDSGVAGIKLFYTVNGDVSGTAVNPGASGSIIDGVRLLSASAGAASSGKYGIESRARVTLRNVEVRGFGDHGIIVQASLSGGDGVVYGNANRCVIENSKSLSNAGDGIVIRGNDTNVSKVDTCHAQNNTGWGFTDDSLIQVLWLCCTDEGNTGGGYRTQRVAVASSFIACETEDSTSTRHSLGTSCVVRGGNLEQVTSTPIQINYSGLTIKSGKVLSLYKTDNTSSLSLSNDGTNILVSGPVKTQGSIQCRNGTVGYLIGNGGAVTQVTSRTTGVTLNTPTGAITLVSAAGSASWQTFTVTNSNVAATDTIIVNQKSGTDIYQLQVTNAAAGSFKISFATTGGTTSEQPVFNFAVIKGASS